MAPGRLHGLVTAMQAVDMAELEKMMKVRLEVYGSLCHAARGLHLIKKRWPCEP